MTEEKNMEVWKNLCETDPNRTKEIKGKKYKGNSINPNYIYEKLTGQFGPCGIGWGFVITKEDFKTGNNGDIIHSVEIGLWYKLDGEKSELIPGKGATTFSGSYQSGPFTDEDAEKKSVTDALTKATQLIGMSADIFGGLWDDCKYIAELKEKYGDNGASTPPPPKNTSQSKGSSPSASTSQSKSPSGVLMITEKQIGMLHKIFKEKGFDDDQRHEWLSDKFGLGSTKNLPRCAVNEFMEIYKNGNLHPLGSQDDIPFQ